MTHISPATPRRILHVLKYYRPDFTGEGVFLERSSAVMQEIAPGTEHDLLVTHTPEPPQREDACNTLARVIYLTRRPLGALHHHLLLAAWFIRNLRRYDAVHFRTHADWYFISYVLTRLFGRRLILSATLDDSLPVIVSHYRTSLQPWASRGLRLFNDYVSISPKLLEETRTMAPEERCHLVPCGVTVPSQPVGTRQRMRSALGYGADDLVLLFVGGICERKDPMFLVEAMPRIVAEHPTSRLVLVGPPLEPDYVAAIQARTARLGLGAHIHMAGEQHNPHPYFAMSDILTFASRLEGFGTVVPEAMAHGLPVVARRLPGVNDSFVLEGETGHLFEDEEGYVAAVLRCAGDPRGRHRMGEAGRNLAAERFGMRSVAKKYLSIYGSASAAVSTKETELGCGASITDRRFHQPFDVSQLEGPVVITMVDAEEAFDWSKPFDRRSNDVRSMAAQHLAHRVFERHGVTPLYLADYPVAVEDAGKAALREFLRGGHCELGSQMHPWVTPPFAEEVSNLNSYAGNLPVDLELAKAERLTNVLGEVFGEVPRIYRTGRFGAGRRTADILKKLGYQADSSVTPCWPAAGIAGSWSFSAAPYWVDREKTLLEIPVAAALVGHLGDTVLGRLAPAVFDGRASRYRIPGILAHLGLLERIRLSPEGMTIAEAKRLVRHMLKMGHRVFVLTYHSPSLEPGNTPYVRTAAQRDEFLRWLDEFYAFFREEAGGRPASWREVRDGVRPPQLQAAQ